MTLPLRPEDIIIAYPAPGTGIAGTAPGGLYHSYGKRAFDIVLALAVLPVAAALVGLFALVLLIKGESPFYSQKRLGRGGQIFTIWKLRTMRADADDLLAAILARDPALREEWNRTQKLKSDPRVTALGAFLRKSSIDELPQVINVLMGQMSMIGPRPMMPQQQGLYGPNLPVYLTMRPGISGQWQVTERNNADFQRRAQIDADYAANLTFGRDLSIVVQTVRTILHSTGH